MKQKANEEKKILLWLITRYKIAQLLQKKISIIKGTDINKNTIHLILVCETNYRQVYVVKTGQGKCTVQAKLTGKQRLNTMSTCPQ